MRANRITTGVFVGVWALMSSLTLSSAMAQRGPEGAAPGDRRLERLLARGEGLRDRQRTTAAARLFRAAADRMPEDPRGPIALAEMLLPEEPTAPDAIRPPAPLRQTAEELKDRLNRVVVAGDTTDPEYRQHTKQVRTLLPWAIALSGDHRGAIDAAALSAGRLDDVAASILRRLGALAVRRHDLVAADHALTAARRADPVDVSLSTDLAALRLARGHAEDAVRLLLEARRRVPGDLTIARDLAGALLSAGRADEALAAFAAIAGEHDDDPRAHLDLARAALEAGHPERATQAAQAARRASEVGDPEAALVLAAARLSANDPAGARAAFREALRLAPDDLRARRGLEALDGSGRLDER
ncbi:MAG: tetratricopeptide repeat protein [Deltaproteobacteria bacterium]|nr:tetratricopeptide repeat protein [Deltaproteobacteria bacterium]